MTTPPLDTVCSGLAFPECPRWHDDRLWFSDVYANDVHRLDPSTGASEIVAHIDGHPAGLGFLPDGRLLIAVGHPRTVMRRESDGMLTPHADLSGFATWHLNDMYVDGAGRAYVGNYGDGSAPPDPVRPAVLTLVEPDGTVRAVADDLLFANGIVATADGRTLVVAETRAIPGRLTAFTVGDDGSLTDRRTVIEFDRSVFPDGLAIDRDDAVWVASPFGNEVIRVSQSGVITDRVPVANPYAVALGGHDGCDLFVCTAENWQPEVAARERTGAIVRLRVDVPGVDVSGRPHA
ncbi:SMP-30/gluconolactonase/LRE family protein [Rhodococcus artemisiae]|uniref:SMP-30/gluconolactonase/LRE family protein n=1 Tax=Rhodococcus artemisiae TaxID=714159 RepID=A0ABU7L996_9NOCA|nr:SMP-30/gluconolactonase/LRE family protein [Rhodococcus artemisiae]MEE2058116.1 SMP-30/gluconolactonase/LRE family protein [Rhodococcus artemisiae]